MQKTRGAIQGFHQGFYRNPSYLIPEKCLPKQATLQLYYIQKYVKEFNLNEFITVFGLMYSIYYNVDFECEVEKYLYDVSMFCFEHNCTFDNLMRNWMNKVIQVTAVLNAIAAVYYEETPQGDSHFAWFQNYSDIGANIGKLVRFCLDFDPRINIY